MSILNGLISNSWKADMFATMNKLQILKLDTNEIDAIPRYTFSGLDKLKVLSLRNNNIRCLSNETFFPFELRELEKLDLYNNKLSEIGEDTLNSFPKLSQLNILNNQLVCDCLLKSTYSFLKSSRGKIGRPESGETLKLGTST